METQKTQNAEMPETVLNMETILREAVKRDAADIFLIPGLPVSMKCSGHQVRLGKMLMPDQTKALVDQILAMSRHGSDAADHGDLDFSFSLEQLARFRVNIFRQRGSMASVIRVIRFGLPDPAQLGIPENVLQFSDQKKGLILVTGAAGSGKSTTLACMIDRINRTREGHIITMEDPIEYIHRHDRSIVTQREISIDSPSYLDALRSALRESPDVILLGEMRDYETISAALTAAETGVLLFSTLHTNSAANTIGRIVDVFPASQQQQVKIQLSQILKGVICQQLVPGKKGELLPAFEVMKATTAVQNMIREDKLHQLDSVLLAGTAEGMCTMDGSLTNLYRAGKISRETALAYCTHYDQMSKRLT